tara:strand:+ start:920 stop:3112 length:2193 start_codon:yes stop_codon:yes gene_type:complete
MNTSDLTSPLVEGLIYAPIYKKDARMLSGRRATGKNPLEESYDRDFDKADVALALRKNPDLQAIGLYTGIRGKGIVILDVDKNLKKLQQVWGDSLDKAPKVVSTKKNAAKYIFYIPEHLWGEVKGHGLRKEDGGDYEILWGRRQGVILGAYPGGRQSVAGHYSLEGSLENIPVAPDWLIAEMKAPPKVHTNRKDLDFSDRTEDEIAQIIHDCLSVISHKGAGSREQWIQIGMAIHSAMPNDMGLALWSHWSSQDPDYANEWEEADDKNTPCTTAWYSFKGSGVGLGTLIWLADREDPARHRFSQDIAEIVKSAESKQVQEIRTSVLAFDEVVKRAKAILDLDNPAEVNYKLNALSLQAGYRDQTAIEKIIVDQLQYENQTGLFSAQDLMNMDIKREYLIPDVLPSPSVVLIYGAGGDGKSMSAWTIAKHVSSGTPFVVRGDLVPVEKGPVLILNGDQPLTQLKEQLEEVDYPVDSNTMILTDWQLQRYAQFVTLMKEKKPKLVIIDSLIGCSGGKAFDENKSDFATPLYWLTRNNGNLFPKTTILIIHHANKNGGFRGTSAIRDAVDETWALSKPSEEESARIGKFSRLITIEKSRQGRMGTQLVMQMQDDLSFTIADHTPEVDHEPTPASVTGRVLQKLRVIHPEARSTNALVDDPLLNGKPAAIRKSIQRLEKRGLIELVGNDPKIYRAIRACGEVQESVPLGVKASDGTRFGMGHKHGTSEKCPIGT